MWYGNRKYPDRSNLSVFCTVIPVQNYMGACMKFVIRMKSILCLVCVLGKVRKVFNYRQQTILKQNFY